MDDARAWASRPLDEVYPIVFLDCLVLKIREGGSVQRRACYLALGVSMDGDRDVLGMWFQETEARSSGCKSSRSSSSGASRTS
jgi:putative transposase